MNTSAVGIVNDLYKFDPKYFNMKPDEANAIGPTQQILLELSIEAFENAGIDITKEENKKTGVFVGLFGSPMQNRAAGEVAVFTPHTVRKSISS